MSDKHDLYSPSRLAFLEKCSDFQGEQDSEAASYGTLIHHLIHCIAVGNAVDCKAEDLKVAGRAYAWLIRTYPDYKWEFERRIEGAIPETGGTLDAVAYDDEEGIGYIVDWKGSLPPPDSAQGAAYAHNLWQIHPLMVECRVIFYSYLTGEWHMDVHQKSHDIEGRIATIIDEHQHNPPEQRRKANYGCSYCVRRATCAVAAKDTVTDLTINSDPMAMSLPVAMEYHAKLSALMKRAEKIEAALKARLMDAARAGELPGYTVKRKGGSMLEWTDPIAAREAIDGILHSHFATANTVGLLPPSKVKAAVKEALGVSYTPAVEQAIDLHITQNSYEVLSKEKA